MDIDANKGRNGGHLVAKKSDRMHALVDKYGPEEAVKSPAIEEHTVSEILKIIKENGWESAVDLVQCRRVDLVFNGPELAAIEKDIAAARSAKVEGIDDVEFLTVEQVEKVIDSLPPCRMALNECIFRNTAPGIQLTDNLVTIFGH